MKSSSQFTSIGGQAVVEGVMMRSPRFIALAVRRSNQKIFIQGMAHASLAHRFPFLKKPVFRGILILIESMVQGMQALSVSALVASEDDASPVGQSKSSRWAIVGSMAIAGVLGVTLFVAFPHLLTVGLTSLDGVNLTAKSPGFHFLDGTFKVLILLVYVYLIAMMDDIHRVFQYHGAEHKSIYAFEAGDALTVENARKYKTLHPRCGTSFLLFLVLISVVVFSIIFPAFHLTDLTSMPVLNHLVMIQIKMVLMIPIAGVAYEFIRACAFRMNHPLFRGLIWPGMVLQKLTTREPTDAQLEVALAALTQVIRLEKGQVQSTPVVPRVGEPAPKSEFEVQSLFELEGVHASVSEFLEN
jgi:uncharacterized protein YqhQ